MYRDGKGIGQDYHQAVKWFRRAAEQGEVDAQVNLGFMYGKGQGVATDYQQAFNWYRKAAEQGDENGEYALGVIYSNGRGVPKDLVRSYMWYSISAASSAGTDQQDAAQRRDKIAAKLTPAQLSQAQQMAAKCQGSGFKNCD